MAQQRRAFDRVRHRLFCELLHDGRRSSGMVLDMSPRGLFVRMGNMEAPPLGTQVQVGLNDAEHGEMILMARVTRAKSVRHELVVAADGGIGLEVLSAPESYYDLLKSLVTV